MKPNSNNENYNNNDYRALKNLYVKNTYKIGAGSSQNTNLNLNEKYFEINKKEKNLNQTKNKFYENEINNFSKTASEFKYFNKHKTEKFYTNPLANREAEAGLNNKILMRPPNLNSDLPSEFVNEENDFNYIKNPNSNFRNTASNFNLKNKDNHASTLKFRGIKSFNI